MSWRMKMGQTQKNVGIDKRRDIVKKQMNTMLTFIIFRCSHNAHNS
jgi:hypothetical protein